MLAKDAMPTIEEVLRGMLRLMMGDFEMERMHEYGEDVNGRTFKRRNGTRMHCLSECLMYACVHACRSCMRV